MKGFAKAGAVLAAVLASATVPSVLAQSASPLRAPPFMPLAKPASSSPMMAPQAAPPAAAPTTAQAPDPEIAASTTWTTVLFENFGLATLNRDRWNVIGPDFWVNNEQQVYVDSPETIFIRQNVAGASKGVLVLKPVYKPGVDPNTTRRAPFISGRIDTAQKLDFQYGRISARIRMSDAQGFWPAFWMLGYGNWPDSGEIDTMEYVGEKGWTSSALHGPGYSGNTPIARRFTFPVGQDVTGWHTYTVVWSRGRINFLVDNALFYSVPRTTVEAYGPWRFDNRKYLILNAAVGGTYPNGVNRVTSPYFGVPQATVDKIKQGKVEFEVDWVRVQQKL